MSKPEVVAHQCSMSLRCKSDTCTHAKPHTPSDCDCPACCGQWPGNADFRPRVVCIPVDQVRAPEDSGNHEKPEAPLTDHERLQAEAERLQADHEAERAADRARIAELEGALTAFIRAAYPVVHEINQRGYNWSDAYLDEALNLSKQLLPQQGKEQTP